MKHIDTISGPVSIVIYYYNNKKYTFFGDVHFSNENSCEQQNLKCDHFTENFKNTIIENSRCTDLGALFHHWFTYNNDHQIPTDVYMETSFTKLNQRLKLDYENESWLTVYPDIVSSCFTADKTQCPYYPYVHMHYTDIRFIYKNEFLIADPFFIQDIITYVLNNVNNIFNINNQNIIHDYKLIINTLVSRYDDIIKIFTKPNYDKYIDILWALAGMLRDDFIKTSYINILINMSELLVKRQNKTYHRVAAGFYKLLQKDRNVASLVLKFYYKQLELLMVDVNPNIDYIDDNVIYYYNNLFHDIHGCTMDFYTLCRMFYQDDSQEIIFYAGENHITRLSYFFEQYLFVNPRLYVPRNDDQRCLFSQNIKYYLDVKKYRIYNYYKQRAMQMLNHLPLKFFNYKQYDEIIIDKTIDDQYSLYYIEGIEEEYKIYNEFEIVQILINILKYNDKID